MVKRRHVDLIGNDCIVESSSSPSASSTRLKNPRKKLRRSQRIATKRSLQPPNGGNSSKTMEESSSKTTSRVPPKKAARPCSSTSSHGRRPTPKEQLPNNIEEEGGDDDDDDGDILLVWGHSPSRDLPHMRQHCTRYPFHTPTRARSGRTTRTSAARTSFNVGGDNDGGRNDPLVIVQTNSKCCDLCYCFVCDIPAKECHQWVSETQKERKMNSEEEKIVARQCLVADHCCANENMEDWVNQRRQERRRRQQQQEYQRQSGKTARLLRGEGCSSLQDTLIYQWVSALVRLLYLLVYGLTKIPFMIVIVLAYAVVNMLLKWIYSCQGPHHCVLQLLLVPYPVSCR